MCILYIYRKISLCHINICDQKKFFLTTKNPLGMLIQTEIIGKMETVWCSLER